MHLFPPPGTSIAARAGENSPARLSSMVLSSATAQLQANAQKAAKRRGDNRRRSMFTAPPQAMGGSAPKVQHALGKLRRASVSVLQGLLLP